MKRVHVVAIGLIGLCFALIKFDDYRASKEALSDADKKTLLGELKREEIDKLIYSDKNKGDYRKRGEINFEVVRRDQGWDVRSPVRSPADRAVVEKLLDSIFNYKFTKEILNTDLGKYGLDTPERTLALYSNNRRMATLAIGDNSPIGYSVYSMVVDLNGNQSIYVGSQHLNVATVKNVFDIRSKSVANFGQDEIDEMHFEISGAKHKNQNRSFKIIGENSNTGEKKWKLDYNQMIFDHVDSGTVFDLFASLNDLKIRFFDKTDISPDEMLTLRLRGKSIADIKFVFAHVGDETYLKAGSYWHQISKGVEKFFEGDVSIFLDRKIIDIASEEVTSIEINGLSFTKKDDEWVKGVNDISSELTDKLDITSFLIDLQYSKYSRHILDKSAISLTTPLLVLNLSSGGDVSENIEVYEFNGSSDQVIVKSPRYQTLGVASKKLFDPLMKSNVFK